MIRGRHRGVVLGLAALLLLPANAAAQQTLAPPGKAGADQYFETIPSAQGNAAPPAGTGSSAGSNGGIGALARLGRDGQSAARLAATTGPQHRPRGYGAGSGVGRSPLSTFSRLLDGTDAGGIGIVLPILFAAALAVAIALALARLRRRDEPA